MLKKTAMVLALGVLLAASFAWAQDAPSAVPAAFDPQTLVAALFAAGLPFLTQAIRHYLPNLPRMLVWAIPPVLGSGLGWALAQATAAAPGGWKGFALGLVAIALREAKSTFDQWGLNGK